MDNSAPLDEEMPPPVEDTALLAALEVIAKKRLRIETLVARCSDSLDFYDCSVWGVKAALMDAYELGRMSATGDETASKQDE